MVKLQLPEGNTLDFPAGVTAAEIIQSIGPGLARKAIAAKVNDQIVDLTAPLPSSSATIPFKAILPDDPDGLFAARHSAAHVMAEAICDLWPQTKLVYGPPVENGFYYDIDLNHNLTPVDFEKVEARMAEIVKEDRPFTRYEMPRAEAMPKLKREGNEYKLDNAERAEGDLCRGPHVPSTGRIGAFKIMQVAGAYHHGDASKKMLQRVYGTAWPSKKDLQAYLMQVDEARKRDHRKIGPELDSLRLIHSLVPG
jgi:threonyl-tRNA synthetase